MSKIVQWKRGNTAATASYTGFPGEITIDSDNWILHIHDGVTPGGHIPPTTSGNLDIVNQTISGTISNANVVIETVGTGSVVLETDQLAVNGNIVPTIGNLYNVGSAQLAWKDAWVGNSVVLNNNTITIDSLGTLRINGAQPAASNISIVKTLSNNTTSIATLANTNLQITATDGTYQSTIYLWANDRKMGFNTISNAFDYNFNGYISATSYVASKNDPTGYSFYTPDEGYSGFSHVNDPVNYIQVKHNDVPSVKFLANNTVDLTGNLVVSAAEGVFGSFPNAFIQTYSNINTYSQLVSQNLNGGNASTSDFVVTSDDGTDLTDYVDLGIAGSGYDNTNPINSLGTSIDARDGYLYVQGNASNAFGGNLTVGTTLPGKVTKILSGGVNAENVVSVFNENGLNPGANLAYSLGSNTAQWNELWASNIRLHSYNVDGSNYDEVLSTQNLSLTGGVGKSVSLISEAFTQLYWTSNVQNANPYLGNDDYVRLSAEASGVRAETQNGSVYLNWDSTTGSLTTSGKFTTYGTLNTPNTDVVSFSNSVISNNSAITYFSSANPAGPWNATLLPGSDGQIKTLIMGTYTGNLVLTVSDAGWKSSGFGTITFTGLGQSCILHYIINKWYCTGNNGVSFA